MKKLLVLLAVFVLSGCELDDENKEEQQDGITFIVDDERVEERYEVSQDLIDLYSSNYLYRFNHIEDSLLIGYYDYELNSALAVFDSELNEMFRLTEGGLNYRPRQFTFGGSYIIDIADHTNADYRLFDEDGVMSESLEMQRVSCLYQSELFSVYIRTITVNEESVLEVVRLEDDVEIVIYSKTNPGLQIGGYYIDEDHLFIVHSGLSGYDIVRMDSDGVISDTMNMPHRPYIYPTENGYFIEMDDTISFYDLNGTDFYYFEYDNLDNFRDFVEYDDVIVYEFSGHYILVDDEYNTFEFDTLPYEEIVFTSSKLVHIKEYVDGSIHSNLILTNNDNQVLFNLEMDEIEYIYYSDTELYFGVTTDSTVTYSVYNSSGELQEEVELLGELLYVKDDGNYIIAACSGSLMNISNTCILEMGQQGNVVWNTEVIYSASNFEVISDDLYVVEGPSFACDQISEGWSGCKSIFINGDGDKVLESQMFYFTFIYLYSDDDHIYVRGRLLDAEREFGGTSAFKLYVLDYDLNIVETYKVLGEDSYLKGYYYVTEDYLIYLEE